MNEATASNRSSHVAQVTAKGLDVPKIFEKFLAKACEIDPDLEAKSEMPTTMTNIVPRLDKTTDDPHYESHVTGSDLLRVGIPFILTTAIMEAEGHTMGNWVEIARMSVEAALQRSYHEGDSKGDTIPKQTSTALVKATRDIVRAEMSRGV